MFTGLKLKMHANSPKTAVLAAEALAPAPRGFLIKPKPELEYAGDFCFGNPHLPAAIARYVESIYRDRMA